MGCHGYFSGLNEENNVFMTQFWNLEPFNIRIELADVHVGSFKKFVNLHHQLRIIELLCSPFQCHRFPWWPSFKKRRNAKECGKLVSTYWDRPLSTYVPWDFEGRIWVVSQFSNHRLGGILYHFQRVFWKFCMFFSFHTMGLRSLSCADSPLISFASCLFKWFLKRSGQNESKEHAFRKFAVIVVGPAGASSQWETWAIQDRQGMDRIFFEVVKAENSMDGVAGSSSPDTVVAVRHLNHLQI